MSDADNLRLQAARLRVLCERAQAKGDHAYAERQDDITYADWHQRRGMSEHMLRTFFAPMALALNFTPVDAISAEAMLRVMAYFASSRDASRAGFEAHRQWERELNEGRWGMVTWPATYSNHSQTSSWLLANSIGAQSMTASAPIS